MSRFWWPTSPISAACSKSNLSETKLLASLVDSLSSLSLIRLRWTRALLAMISTASAANGSRLRKRSKTKKARARATDPYPPHGAKLKLVRFVFCYVFDEFTFNLHAFCTENRHKSTDFDLHFDFILDSRIDVNY